MQFAVSNTVKSSVTPNSQAETYGPGFTETVTAPGQHLQRNCAQQDGDVVQSSGNQRTRTQFSVPKVKWMHPATLDHERLYSARLSSPKEEIFAPQPTSSVAQ